MQTETQLNNERGFDQMAQGMKTAVQDFDTARPEDVINQVLTAIRPAREFGMQVWTKLADYSRRHPVRMTVSAIALGLIIARMRKRS